MLQTRPERLFSDSGDYVAIFQGARGRVWMERDNTMNRPVWLKMGTGLSVR